MVQAAVLDGFQFDASPFGQNGFATAIIDIGRGEVADVLVVAVVVVVVDEGRDGGFKLPFEEVVFQQDPVFESLMPSLDFALCLCPYGDASIAYRVTDASARREYVSCPCPQDTRPDRQRCKTSHYR